MSKKNTADKPKKPVKEKKMHSSSAALITKVVGIAVVVLLVLSIGMMIASQFFPGAAVLHLPRVMVNKLITPLQKTFAGATDSAAAYLRRLKYRSTLEDEYNKLLERVNELTDQAMRVQTLEYELAQYEDLSEEIARNHRMDGIKANVIGTDTSNYTYTLTIDVGSKQGVKNNMAVVIPGALIGYTYGVEENSALVKCIIDDGCSIAALIESSRDQGTLQGTLSLNGQKECRMYYLSYSTLPRPGDRVVTSGVGMEFPKGIPIGYVRESTRGREDSKQFVVVDPVADFEHIEYVIVYRYRPAQAEKADNRRTLSEATFVPLPTMMPVATFIGQKTLLTPTPLPSETPEPDITPVPDATEQPAPTEDDVVYNDRKAPNATPEPTPSPTPDPTDTPKPTFSVEQMTVEDD